MFHPLPWAEGIEAPASRHTCKAAHRSPNSNYTSVQKAIDWTGRPSWRKALLSCSMCQWWMLYHNFELLPTNHQTKLFWICSKRCCTNLACFLIQWFQQFQTWCLHKTTKHRQRLVFIVICQPSVLRMRAEAPGQAIVRQVHLQSLWHACHYGIAISLLGWIGHRDRVVTVCSLSVKGQPFSRLGLPFLWNYFGY